MNARVMKSAMVTSVPEVTHYGHQKDADQSLRRLAFSGKRTDVVSLAITPPTFGMAFRRVAAGRTVCDGDGHPRGDGTRLHGTMLLRGHCAPAKTSRMIWKLARPR